MSAVIDEITVRTALSEPISWPNLSQAAGITGLSKSTLSKQAQAGKITSEALGFGRGERVLPPAEVLRIGYRYHRISQAMLVERLARFLSTRLSIDANLAQQVLWALMGTVCRGQNLDRVGDSSQNFPTSGGTTSLETRVETPNWLLEVEHLREDLSPLKGMLSFTSANDPIGTIDFGPSIDEPIGADLTAWNAVW